MYETGAKTPTAGIVLAAGMSTRMKGLKQLLPLRDKALLLWVLEAALSSGLERVVLVLGHEAHRIAQALGGLLNHPRLETACNDGYRDGMASSLKAGLLRVKDQYPSAMFLLGDQPLVTSGTIDLLLERFWSSGKGICVPMHDGKRGNPTLFAGSYYDRILALQGDLGARGIIEENPDDVLCVELSDPHIFLDIDREEDIPGVQSQGRQR